MLNNYKYKDSGVEWLGELPTNWEIRRLKYLTSCNSDTLLESTDPDKDIRYVDISSVVYPQGIQNIEDMVFSDAPSRARRLVKNGDTIVSTVRTYLKAIAPIEGDDDSLVVSTGFAVIRPRYLVPKYLSRFLMSHYCVEAIASMSVGVSYPAVNAGDIGNIFSSEPPIEEQQAIAAFLDRETSRIDALIQKKERLIELLKEKRIALIKQAVTKGLDPTVPMKDSGIEWLGEVPEHWEVKKLRYITTRIQTGCTPPTSVEEYYDSGTVDWFGPSSFKEALYLTEPVKLINQQAIDDGSARLFSKGTIMLIGIGATIGKIAQITQDASCNQQITAITMKARIVNSDYATYQLKLLEDIIRGIAPSATLAIFDQNKISDLSMAIPPIREQNDIVDQLMLDIGHIEKLEIEVQSSITLLREYRSALINAAVTGKIDLREAL